MKISKNKQLIYMLKLYHSNQSDILDLTKRLSQEQQLIINEIVDVLRRNENCKNNAAADMKFAENLK
jgi:hypothetical protein